MNKTGQPINLRNPLPFLRSRWTGQAGRQRRPPRLGVVGVQDGPGMWRCSRTATLQWRCPGGGEGSQDRPLVEGVREEEELGRPHEALELGLSLGVGSCEMALSSGCRRHRAGRDPRGRGSFFALRSEEGRCRVLLSRQGSLCLPRRSRSFDRSTR